jgi:hypothetical protein
LFAGLVALHGLIHLMGFAKSFGHASLPQLVQPISRAMGLVWLAAAALTLGASAASLAWPRSWWWMGAASVVVSQFVIVSSWSDAKFGTLANLILAAGAALSFATYGPSSLHAEFDREARAAAARAGSAPPLSEADLVSMPDPVRRYMRLSGAVGQPRVRNFHAVFAGRIRGGPQAAWMTFTGEQYNFYGPAERIFIMDAARSGVPVVAFHRFQGTSASMRVKVASVFPVVDASGPEMLKAETVTLFNDLCVFAPGALVDPAVAWREVDATHAVGRYLREGVAVEARLTFDDQGRLIDFVSNDRLAGSADGRTFKPIRWSTPLRNYRGFGAATISASGAGRWHPPGEEAYDYIQLELQDIRYNVSGPAR